MSLAIFNYPGVFSHIILYAGLKYHGSAMSPGPDGRTRFPVEIFKFYFGIFVFKSGETRRLQQQQQQQQDVSQSCMLMKEQQQGHMTKGMHEQKPPVKPCIYNKIYYCFMEAAIKCPVFNLLLLTRCPPLRLFRTQMFFL